MCSSTLPSKCVGMFASYARHEWRLRVDNPGAITDHYSDHKRYFKIFFPLLLISRVTSNPWNSSVSVSMPYIKKRYWLAGFYLKSLSPFSFEPTAVSMKKVWPVVQELGPPLLVDAIPARATRETVNIITLLIREGAPQTSSGSIVEVVMGEGEFIHW